MAGWIVCLLNTKRKGWRLYVGSKTLLLSTFFHEMSRVSLVNNESV